MKNFFKTYKSVIILLAAIIIGAIVGIAFGEKAAVLSPFGDIFLNLLFVTIVPLVFLSITTSISRIKQPKRLGKILVTIIALFAITTIIAALVGVFATNVVKLVDTENGEQIKASLDSETEEEEFSSNYLGSYVLELAGVEMPLYNKILMNIKAQLPVIGMGAYCDKDGNWYSDETLPEEYKKLISQYQILQYNDQFEKKNIREKLFRMEN